MHIYIYMYDVMLGVYICYYARYVFEAILRLKFTHINIYVYIYTIILLKCTDGDIYELDIIQEIKQQK